MQINNYLKALVLIYIVFHWQSCSVKEQIIDQEKLNAIGQNALKYALQNECFTFQSFPSDSTLNFISVCSELQNFDSEINTEYIDNLYKIKKSKLLQFDTIKIENWSDKQVFMNPRKDIIFGMRFSEKFSEKIDNSTKLTGIRSYIFSKPILLKYDNGYTFIFKIARYFENTIEYIYLFLETDLGYNLKKISCQRPKLKEIPHYLRNYPEDRPFFDKNIEFYVNKNNAILVLTDSLLYKFDQGSIFSYEKYNKVKNNSFISQTPHFCTDNNQEYYETLIEIQSLSANSIKLVSSDTCENRRLSISGNVYSNLDFNKEKVFWDSIVIQNNNNPRLKKLIPSNQRKFRYHFLTIDQEVYLLAKNIISLKKDSINKKSIFSVKIYAGGKIIKSISGNSFPYTLNSIYFKFIE